MDFSPSESLLFSIAMDSTGPEAQSLEKTKKRLKAFELCNDKVTAAALAYLLAQREQTESHFDIDVFDDICALISNYDKLRSPEYTTERIFERIYDWLKVTMKEASSEVLEELATMFDPFIVK
jgi:hypothetical protein